MQKLFSLCAVNFLAKDRIIWLFLPTLIESNAMKRLITLIFSAVLLGPMLSGCSGGESGGGASSSVVPDTSNTYTSLASSLQSYVAADQAGSSSTNNKSISMNSSIVLGADYYADTPAIMTANYGFEGYMGVANLQGNGASGCGSNCTQILTLQKNATYAGNVSFENLDESLQATGRAYYSGVGATNFQNAYDVTASQMSQGALATIPVVFTHPVWPPSVTTAAFQVTLNNGTVITPLAASLLPNTEYNERQTEVLSGYFGNRITSGASAVYPVSVTIANSSTKLQFVTPVGLVSAFGLTKTSQNPYITGNGPKLLAAKLNVYSSLGESNPSWNAPAYTNSGSDLFGASAWYRLRLYTSAGFSPDGIASLMPTDFSKYFILSATDVAGKTIQITQTGVSYSIPGFGSVTVVGLADTGSLQSSYNAAYIEDHDNQYDVILTGDAAAIARLSTVQMPSSGSYSPVYNPGGPGNNPSSNPPGVPFTVPSSDHTVSITNNLRTGNYVSYVTIGCSPTLNANGQPIGVLQGVAVTNNATCYTVNQYISANNCTFYASFPVASK